MFELTIIKELGKSIYKHIQDEAQYPSGIGASLSHQLYGFLHICVMAREDVMITLRMKRLGNYPGTSY
jgi:hypothetical protein